MSVHLITICVAILLVAIPLLILDFSTVLGEVWSSGALERWTVIILLPLSLVGGLALSFGDVDSLRGCLKNIFPYENSAALLAVTLSSAVTVIVTSMISRYTSLPYAFVGALFGCRLMVEGSLNWDIAIGILASWVVAPLLCALLAACISSLSALMGSHGRNIVKADNEVLRLCTIAAVLFAGSYAWNNGVMLSLLSRDLSISEWIPFIVTIITVPILFFILLNAIRAEGWRIADMELEIPVSSVFSVMAASGITLLLFSSPVVSIAHLTPAPVSVTSLLIASLFSISLVTGRPAMEGDRIAKSVVANVAAPILGLLVSYCICVILNASPTGSGIRDLRSDLTPLLILIGIILIVSGLVLYVRFQRSHELRKQIINSREQQASAAHKSLADIEVKAEMNEKELLNKLEIKRKELVDFAVGISDQKAFMEEVYGELKKIRQIQDSGERDERTDALLSSIRERMYLSRDLHDFYAQSEILHKDFNMRLREAFPKLTESERKLANLLRQGLSSKQIASMMNITPKSVEISRYRLRSKLGLKRSDNLTHFIKTI